MIAKRLASACGGRASPIAALAAGIALLGPTREKSRVFAAEFARQAQISNMTWPTSLFHRRPRLRAGPMQRWKSDRSIGGRTMIALTTDAAREQR